MTSQERTQRGGIRLVILDEAHGLPRTTAWVRDGIAECFRVPPTPTPTLAALRYSDSGARATWEGTTLPLWTSARP